MGNSTSDYDERTSHALSGYQYSRTDYEWNLGEVQIFKYNGGKEQMLLVKERIFDSEERSNQFAKDIKKYKELHHPNIYPINQSIGKIFNNFKDATSSQFCSKSYKFTLISQFNDTTVVDLMKERKMFSKKGDPRFFDEEEIWDFMKQILSGVRAARDAGIIFDDIQPKNIIVENNNASTKAIVYKLINPRYYLPER